MPTIYDTRNALAMTIEEADEKVKQYAELEINATLIAAKYEKRKAELLAKAEAELKPFFAQMEAIKKEVIDYVLAHPKRFESPRKRKTEWATYGLHQATTVCVIDKEAAIASIKAQGIDALKITEEIQKKKLDDAIKKDGVTITGVEIRTGELVKCDTLKNLIDKAKKGA